MLESDWTWPFRHASRIIVIHASSTFILQLFHHRWIQFVLFCCWHDFGFNVNIQLDGMDWFLRVLQTSLSGTLFQYLDPHLASI